ncbi:hypothetical protein CXQ85_000554 [Candidozyma haemuli]|uniref:Membrane anchor Opy2 N-terminal domain-containing protein n=1 Tax=Candidozyma haemuli TaxID=45357 RepID=A0A2V1AUW4_9ASCO|nr:hypothetical protein CXQ85_000554 [[Candida] haemuloni]PVH21572.1 hypothetical protein CXQ85_000554 [[Candida] haemuloni]
MKIQGVALLALAALTSANQQYCKCVCSGNSVVGKIDKCGLCNSSWCLEQNDKLCQESDEGEENILITCFQIESSKEKFIIVAFVFSVLGLLLVSYWKQVMRERNRR